MRNFIKSFLWVLPFLSFLAGYQLLRFISHTEIVQVPAVVGMHMHDAIKILSADKLNVRILAEKVDPDAPEGIIVGQNPPQGRMVKPHQSIFVVITRKPPKPKTPALYGLSLEEATQQTKERKIALKSYSVESLHPEGTGIAQNRQPGQELEDKNLTILVSDGTTPLRLFPDLKGRRITDVQAFFKPYGLKVEVTHPDSPEGHTCTECVVVDQRPLPGTIIDLKKAPSVVLTTAIKN